MRFLELNRGAVSDDSRGLQSTVGVARSTRRVATLEAAITPNLNRLSRRSATKVGCLLSPWTEVHGYLQRPLRGHHKFNRGAVSDGSSRSLRAHSAFNRGAVSDGSRGLQSTVRPARSTRRVATHETFFGDLKLGIAIQ